MEPKKNTATKKWLLGCGIGCGAVLIIVVFLIIGGVVFVKNMVKSFEESEDVFKDLTDKYGEIEEYCPSPSGKISPERMEAFLETREAIRPVIEDLEHSIYFLSDDDESSGGAFKRLRTGLGLIPKIAEFLKTRNLALLESEMGLGEYYYIYTIAYYSWLDKPLTDGPPIAVNENNEFNYQHWEDEESEEIRHDLAVRRLHKMILPMLKNQYEKLMESRGIEISEDWKDALEREINAMEENRYRLAWQDGLPEVIVSSLLPYRTRLESSYSSSVNNIEFIIEQRQSEHAVR